MAVLSDIPNALNTRLNSLANLPTVIWPNTEAQPVANASWFRPTLLPTRAVLEQTGGIIRYTGIYQIDVFTPLRKGVKPLNDYLDALLSHFRGQRLTSGSSIIHVLAVGSGALERNESWLRGFIEINYLTEG